MFKKKILYQIQLILKINKKKSYKNSLILKSFKYNQFNNSLNRLSYFCLEYSKLEYYQYYSSIQNLICPISLSTKVPSSKHLYSRYFFNNQLNKLTISNLIK